MDVDLTNLLDLSQPGTHDFERKTLTVTNPALRKTKAGLSINYDFPVNVYIPQGLNPMLYAELNDLQYCLNR